MEKTGRRARHKVEAQGDAGAEYEKARHGAGNCRGAAAQRILRGDSGKIRRLPGTPGEEEKARRGERSGGRKRGRRGRKSAFAPACPRLLRCSGDEVPQVIAHKAFPIFSVGFRSGPLPRMFRNAAAVRRTLPARDSRSRPTLSAGAQAPASSPAPRSLLRFFLFLHFSPHFVPSASAPPFPREPPNCPRSPRQQPTKKRAEFPPRVFSCGPDAAAVHRRIRTCIQNEARRASRS